MMMLSLFSSPVTFHFLPSSSAPVMMALLPASWILRVQPGCAGSFQVPAARMVGILPPERPAPAAAPFVPTRVKPSPPVAPATSTRLPSWLPSFAKAGSAAATSGAAAATRAMSSRRDVFAPSATSSPLTESVKSFWLDASSCAIMPAAAIIARRPFWSSLVCISFSSAGSVGFSESGSKPRSPASWSERISHGMPAFFVPRGKQSRCLEAEDREDLRNRNGDHNRRPERLERRLLEREVGRDVDIAAEKRVEVLANDEAERRQHTNTPVLQFDLAVDPDLALRDVVRGAEAERIKEAHRSKNARKSLRVSLAVKRILAAYREREELLTRRKLLRNHAGRRNHSQAPVLEFFGLHLLQLRRVGRLQRKRIETKVASLVVGTNFPRHARFFCPPRQTKPVSRS